MLLAFKGDVKESGEMYALEVKDEEVRAVDRTPILGLLRPLLANFKGIMSEELPNGLPPLRGI